MQIIFNLFAVWALTGLWHGANFNFIAWGIYYFVILVLEKYVYGKYLEKLPSLLKHIYALFLILLGWTIFYFEDFGQAIQHMVHPKETYIPNPAMVKEYETRFEEYKRIYPGLKDISHRISSRTSIY